MSDEHISEQVLLTKLVFIFILKKLKDENKQTERCVPVTVELVGATKDESTKKPETPKSLCWWDTLNMDTRSKAWLLDINQLWHAD